MSTDTRTLAPGALFLALRGPSFDGHDFLDRAFAAGAAAAVVAAGRAVPAGCACLVVRDTGEALRALAAGYRRRVGCEVVAVTGSAGKSTVKEMLAAALSPLGPVAKTRGNWNNDIGVPLSLLAMEPDVRIGVFEAGTNHPGEIAALVRLLEPAWGVVTNVGPVHVEHFGSVEAVAREKASLLAAVPSSGTAVIGCDHAHVDALRAAAQCRIVTVSARGPADYCAAGMAALSGAGVRVRAQAHGEPFAFELHVPGEHHVLDALLAIAVAREHGLDWAALLEGLAGWQPMPMRWTVERMGEVTVVNDAYNANPLSMRAALKAFACLPCAGRRWLVLGDMLELGATAEAEHRRLGLDLGGGPWAGLVTVGPLAKGMAEGAREAGVESSRVVACREAAEAAPVVASWVAPGDAVLLKGSRGMRLERVGADLAVSLGQGSGRRRD